jgi:hypothetical protein
VSDVEQKSSSDQCVTAATPAAAFATFQPSIASRYG